MATRGRKSEMEAEKVQTKLLAVLDSIKELPLSSQQEALSVLEQKVKDLHVSAGPSVSDSHPDASQASGTGRSSRTRKGHVQDSQEKPVGRTRKTRSRTPSKKKSSKEEKKKSDASDAISLDMEVENVSDPSNVEQLFDDSDDGFEANVNLGNVTAALSLSSDSDDDVIENDSDFEKRSKSEASKKTSQPVPAFSSPSQSSFALAFQVFAVGNSVSSQANSLNSVLLSSEKQSSQSEQQTDNNGSTDGCNLKIVNVASLAPTKKKGKTSRKSAKALETVPAGTTQLDQENVSVSQSSTGKKQRRNKTPGTEYSQEETEDEKDRKVQSERKKKKVPTATLR